MLFPCYSFLFILIEAIKTGVWEAGIEEKEIILFLFSSIIEYNDPADWPQFLSPPQVLFSSVSITKAGQKRTLCCYLLKVKKIPRLCPILLRTCHTYTVEISLVKSSHDMNNIA